MSGESESRAPSVEVHRTQERLIVTPNNFFWLSQPQEIPLRQVIFPSRVKFLIGYLRGSNNLARIASYLTDSEREQIRRSFLTEAALLVEGVHSRGRPIAQPKADRPIFEVNIGSLRIYMSRFSTEDGRSVIIRNALGNKNREGGILHLISDVEAKQGKSR